MNQIRIFTPGEILQLVFLIPLRLSKSRLAKEIGVSARQIGDIVKGKHEITADTDLRLSKYFNLSEGWWLRGQASYNMTIARKNAGKACRKITPI